MAKKLSKKKSSKFLNKKKSFLDSLLSFRKILVYSIVITFVLFTYKSLYVTSRSVEGASTESTFKYKLKMIVYKEKSTPDAKRQSDEPCLAKTFRVKIKDKDENVKQVTATGSSDCKTYAIPVPSTTKGYCNTVTFVNDLANWTITGIQYSDPSHNGKVLLGQSSVKVCVYPPSEGLSVSPYAIINFGLKPR